MQDMIITECYNRLVESIQTMNAWLDETAVDCRAYQLPILTDHISPEYVDVERLTDHESLVAAQAAYRQFQFDELQDARTAFRLPGTVIIPEEAKADAVASVNTLKHALKASIYELEANKHRRSALCNRLLPKMAMGQIYRQIVWLGDNIRSVHFTWSPRTVGSKQMSRDVALHYVDTNMTKEAAMGRSARVSALGLTHDTLSRLHKDSTVYYRRPVPPHPRANVLYQDGTVKMHHANLPFILSGVATDIDVVDLDVYDGANRRGSRSDKQNLHCLHEGLKLYVERSGSDAISTNRGL